MGNPLSLLLAEIFIINLKIVLFWNSFGDDILLGINDTNRPLYPLLNYDNLMHKNIQLTK